MSCSKQKGLGLGLTQDALFLSDLNSCQSVNFLFCVFSCKKLENFSGIRSHENVSQIEVRQEQLDVSDASVAVLTLSTEDQCATLPGVSQRELSESSPPLQLAQSQEVTTIKAIS